MSLERWMILFGALCVVVSLGLILAFVELGVL